MLVQRCSWLPAGVKLLFAKHSEQLATILWPDLGVGSSVGTGCGSGGRDRSGGAANHGAVPVKNT